MFSMSARRVFLVIIIPLLLLQGCAFRPIEDHPARPGEERWKKQDVIGGKGAPGQKTSIRVFHQIGGWPILKTPTGVIMSKLSFGKLDDPTAGQKLIDKFAIGNPVEMVKNNFLREIRPRVKSVNFLNVPQVLSYQAGTLEKLQRTGQTGTILKFFSDDWQIWYFPSSKFHYQMLFSVSAELIRLSDDRVLWTATCTANQDNQETAPTFDELAADNSQILQQWVNDSSARCATQLVNDFISNR